MSNKNCYGMKVRTVSEIVIDHPSGDHTFEISEQLKGNAVTLTYYGDREERKIVFRDKEEAIQIANGILFLCGYVDNK